MASLKIVSVWPEFTQIRIQKKAKRIVLAVLYQQSKSHNAFTAVFVSSLVLVLHTHTLQWFVLFRSVLDTSFLHLLDWNIFCLKSGPLFWKRFPIHGTYRVKQPLYTVTRRNQCSFFNRLWNIMKGFLKEICAHVCVFHSISILTALDTNSLTQLSIPSFVSCHADGTGCGSSSICGSSSTVSTNAWRCCELWRKCMPCADEGITSEVSVHFVHKHRRSWRK